MTYNLQYCVVI